MTSKTIFDLDGKSFQTKRRQRGGVGEAVGAVPQPHLPTCRVLSKERTAPQVHISNHSSTGHQCTDSKISNNNLKTFYLGWTHHSRQTLSSLRFRKYSRRQTSTTTTRARLSCSHRSPSWRTVLVTWKAVAGFGLPETCDCRPLLCSYASSVKLLWLM